MTIAATTLDSTEADRIVHRRYAVLGLRKHTRCYKYILRRETREKRKDDLDDVNSYVHRHRDVNACVSYQVSQATSTM